VTQVDREPPSASLQASGQRRVIASPPTGDGIGQRVEFVEKHHSS